MNDRSSGLHDQSSKSAERLPKAGGALSSRSACVCPNRLESGANSILLAEIVQERSGRRVGRVAGFSHWIGRPSLEIAWAAKQRGLIAQRKAAGGKPQQRWRVSLR